MDFTFKKKNWRHFLKACQKQKEEPHLESFCMRFDLFAVIFFDFWSFVCFSILVLFF